MINPIKINNVVLGSGKPKLIIPIVDRDHKSIINRVKSFGNRPIDIVEWRIDFFEEYFNDDSVISVLKDIRKELPDIVILATMRTKKEGGQVEISSEEYLKLNALVAKYADLVDVEIFSGDEIVKKNIECIHKLGSKVVGSNHDFNKTPPKEEIINRLVKMQKMGADISKIALMPNAPSDVLTLLSATYEFNQKYADRPVLTMSMGGLGSISRMCGEIFGSCASFGCLEKSSAPGQIDIDDLSLIVEILHNAK